MTTKRTHGPCTCGYSILPVKEFAVHDPDCPSIYPAQQEPDALTRLVRVVRAHVEHGYPEGPAVFEAEALALISEAREEQRKAAVRAKNEGLETARNMVSNVGLKNLASLIEASKESEP